MQTFSDLRGQSGPEHPSLFEAPPVVRTFDTPEFRGVTFYEVQAKSLLNHVPASSYVPFRWTVNVFRGCTHSCTFCLIGETAILMADGRTKPLSEVRPGNVVYGTVPDGRHRRYVASRVLDHWSTTKPAYRVTLEDGTRLIASGDHPFLTQQGWKHVAGLEGDSGRRPHLTVGDKLLGTGAFASPPEKGPDYRDGYLCGMIRGDGHVGAYHYERPGRTHGDIYQFRLALTDFEALGQTYRYLKELDVRTNPFVYQRATTKRKKLTAIRTSTRSGVLAIKEMTAWPANPSTDWAKGFLAGIFDAEGCYPRREPGHASLYIDNTDHEIIDRVTTCLRRLGLPFTLVTRQQQHPVTKLPAKPLTRVRIAGGVREHLRFFHSVDPVITRKRAIDGLRVNERRPLRVVAIVPLRLSLPMFDITTETGDFVADGMTVHNCYARPTHTYLNFDAGEDFERKIVVKVNAPEVLRRELRKPSWAGEHVAMGTNTDPYQRCEGRYQLTRGVLQVMLEYRNPCSILTKSPLLTRDLDLMVALHQKAGFSAALSVGTLDEDVWRRSEPGTPHPRARIDAVRRLRAAGVPCGVLMGPVLPGISDHPDQLRAVVEAAADADATHISGITLHLRRGVKEFMPWLRREYPHLVRDYRSMYRGAQAPAAVRERISAGIDAARQRTGGARWTWRETAEELQPRAPAEPEQLALY